MGHFILYLHPSFEVLWILPPQKNEHFTPPRKEDQSADTLTPGAHTNTHPETAF